MLKSNQIMVFWHFEDIQQIQKCEIFQGRGRPQGNINKKEIRLFQKQHETKKKTTQMKRIVQCHNTCENQRGNSVLAN